MNIGPGGLWPEEAGIGLLRRRERDVAAQPAGVRPGEDCAARISPLRIHSSSQETLALTNCSVWVPRSLASASSIRIRRAACRRAMTVARCSAELDGSVRRRV